MRRRGFPGPREIAFSLALAAVYFVAGKLGLRLAFVHPSATALWPPAAIALTALLVLGYRVWPGIFLGAFLVNLTTAGSIATSLGIAMGNTLEGVLGAYLVNRFAGGRKAFEHARNFFKFAFLAGMVSTTVSPTVGITTLSLGGFANWAHFGAIWMTWWLGDAVAVVTVAPFLLLWIRSPRVRWNTNRIFEATVSFTTLCLVSEIVFGGLFSFHSKNYPLGFVCIPILIWIAFRFGQRECATAIVALSGIALWGSLHGAGPFVTEVQHEPLLFLQAFLGVVAVMTLAIAGVVSERKQAVESLRTAHDRLEIEVQHRTKALSNAIEALLESEARLRPLVESNIIGIILADTGGRVRDANDAFLQMVGCSSEEVAAGKVRLDEMTPAEYRDLDHRTIEELKSTGAFSPFEKEFLRKDGTRVYVLIGAAVLSKSVDKLDCVCFVLDITARKRAEAKFRGLLESAPDAMVIVDQKGCIRLVNVQTEKIFGYGREELLDQAVEILIPEKHRGKHIAHRTDYSVEPRNRPMGLGLELFGRRKDGSEFPVEISLSPLETEEGLLFSAAIRDITARKRSDDRIHALYVEREHNAKELEAANRELKEINRELESFSYSISHDLRAPLRHIEGFSQILLEEYASGLKPEAQHCLQRIQEGVGQMGRMVNDLLQLGRVGRQALHPLPTPLKPLVLDALAVLKSETEGRSVDWQIDDLPVVECDPGLLKLVFVNLLSNAIKFTRLQEHAIIQVGQVTKDGERAIFIRDNGIGFNMRYVHKLFGIFQRLHRQADFEGTGVGLANVQRIVHKHGGRVWAEAEPFKGATFYFTLDTARESESELENSAGLRGNACQQTE